MSIQEDEAPLDLDFLEKIRDEEPKILDDIQEISETTFLTNKQLLNPNAKKKPFTSYMTKNYEQKILCRMNFYTGTSNSNKYFYKVFIYEKTRFKSDYELYEKAIVTKILKEIYYQKKASLIDFTKEYNAMASSTAVEKIKEYVAATAARTDARIDELIKTEQSASNPKAEEELVAKQEKSSWTVRIPKINSYGRITLDDEEDDDEDDEEYKKFYIEMEYFDERQYIPLDKIIELNTEESYNLCSNINDELIIINQILIAHGIYHNDFAVSSNILINQETNEIVLLDFGEAHYRQTVRTYQFPICRKLKGGKIKTKNYKTKNYKIKNYKTKNYKIKNYKTKNYKIKKYKTKNYKTKKYKK
jgi:serine/threonine protein kinase